MELADREGIDALTMRRLAAALDVEAMSLYHHVPNKEAVLDGVAELIVEEIRAEADGTEKPDPVEDWAATLRSMLLAARRVQMRHKWAPAVIATRSHMSPTIIGWFDEVLGVMHAGGFSWDLAHHSMHAIGSQALGFVQEMFVPASPEAEEANDEMFEAMIEHFPNLAAMMAEISHDSEEDTLGWCDDQTEFEFSVDVLLDGLERRRLAQN
ncbi:MAG: TetR/AcrR family transcriptional regulator C-terminal domain-containing protein [Microthrixaceae bacterium]